MAADPLSSDQTVKDPWQHWRQKLQNHRVIAVIRAPQLSVGKAMAMAAAQGGVRLLEITWNSDQAAELIAWLRRERPDCCIGVGTLLTLADFERAVQAGAQFAFMPHGCPRIIQAARQQGIPIVPGALTPSEIVAAWQAGAACVKVFPIQAVGGASYLRHLQGPLGHIPLIPTGGVTLNMVPELLAEGAIAVGLSGALFPPAAIRQQQWSLITEYAHCITDSIRTTPLAEKLISNRKAGYEEVQV